jgi:putative transposase
MGRAWRIEYEGAFYHVLSRGNERREIFYGDDDRRLFLDTIVEASKRFGIDIFAFVLMPNHYHLLLRTNHSNLSKGMQWLGVAYTRRFNNRHFRSGHLFQGRFKSMLVENDAYMMELSCYIHRNPLRAGMVKRFGDYRWSSYPSYAYGKKLGAWLKTSLILSQFSGKDRHKAYREKVQSYSGEEGKLWEDFRHGLFLGTSRFVDRIREVHILGEPQQEIPQQKEIMRPIEPVKVLEKASDLLGCELEKFRTASRLYREEDKERRDLLVYLLWGTGALTNERIGELFGISYSSVSHIVKSVKTKVKEDRKFAEKLRWLKSQFKM